MSGLGRRHLGPGAMMFLLVAAGCSVGRGSGEVTGGVSVRECTFDSSAQPTPLAADFRFVPSFFAAEPVDSNTMRFPANQLIVRLQTAGTRVENSDVLMFRVLDSAAVARCLRGGALPDRAQDWDDAVCDRAAASLGPSGEGRLRIGMTNEVVRGFFALNNSCPKAYVSADALGVCEDDSCPDVALCPGRNSWITFSAFGDMPATGVIPPTYRVNDGETIAASFPAGGPPVPMFHVELCDRGTVEAKLSGTLPIPAPNIVGTLEGNFSFKLERGQAGQPFP